MEKKLRIPTYQKIAVDIASKIVENQYFIGEKIYTRSTLASGYNVSSETARRAVSILSDLGIVETIKGSGVIIKSYEKALEFVREFKDLQTVNSLVVDIKSSISRQKEETLDLEKKIRRLTENIARFQSINPFIPFEVIIKKTTHYINKNISEVNFWHHTGATVIAIKRNNHTILSPGPYADFQENDVFYFIGDEDSYRRVMEFLYPSDSMP
ncbi:MAG TPA: GntR family transcriptional regulator [Clostridiales bacterium]|nr:GntR family transcriptional regulator [Clostridiales bacterium]